MREVRFYRIVHWVEAGKGEWVVVAESLRDDETWDVIDHFTSKRQAQLYVADVQRRQREVA